MPVVRVSDASFLGLKSIAEWHGITTPSAAIDKVVFDAMNGLGLERDELSPGDVSVAERYATAPGLAHTKPITASVAGRKLAYLHWSEILLEVIRQIKSTGVVGDRLVEELQIPAKHLRYAMDGYKYHDDLGIAIQGQSATDAWKETARLAAKWKIPVSVRFRWSQSPRAQHPGQHGLLEVN